jgi:Ca2+-transporting ATPase
VDDALNPNAGQPHPYQQTIDTVIAALGTEPERGLDDREARGRLARDGANELSAESPVPAWKKLLAQFQNVLVVLLLVATAISAGLWLYEGDTTLPYEAIAIGVVCY